MVALVPSVWFSDATNERLGWFQFESTAGNASSPRLATEFRPQSCGRRPRDRDFLTIFKQARRGVGLYPASRDRYLSVIHVRDVVRGIIAAATSAESVGRTYFLTAEPAVSWRDVYAAVAEAVGKPISEINIPQPLVDAAGVLGDVHAWLTGSAGLVTRQKIALSKADYWVCSGARAAREFGFRAGIGLREGMRGTYRWYSENGWLP